MARRARVPSYGLHKPSGQARVIIDGKQVYLGKHGSPGSLDEYARVIAEHFATPSAQPPPDNGSKFPRISVNEMLVAYWDFARQYYCSRDGHPTKEQAGIRDALKPLKALYGHTDATIFGPKSLKALREHMIGAQGLARTEINKRINRVRRAFRWAVSEELLPPAVYEGLRTVQGLRHGRTRARETEPIKPVPDAWVDAVLPYVAPQVSAMIQIQRLAGMRPQDVVRMRPIDIDMSGDVWVYRPYDHKNAWRGGDRFVPIGPKAQKIIAEFLDRPVNAFLFSPREAYEWWKEQRRKERQGKRRTPVYPCESRRVAQKKAESRRRKPKRPKRDCYDTDSYRRSITYGIKRARKHGVEVPHWCPLQLRHSRATEVREVYGVEGAQVILGHKRADITEVYAERNLALAKTIARRTG